MMSQETANPEVADVTPRVQAIIDSIRPYVQSDGGDVELLKVEDGVVWVRLVGACVGCPSSLMTLKGGIENRIREEIPEIRAVEMM
jgi:Fe-S cluster biogenesis protein NfuA